MSYYRKAGYQGPRRKEGMPYSSNKDLPKGVRRKLSSHAQDIYRKVFNEARDRYKGDESRAFATAWHAVKQGWDKKEKGKWSRKAVRKSLDMTNQVVLVGEEPMELVFLKKAADEPYGDVTYADPGYKEDGKKRYPLTRGRLVAAWRYINMPKNHEGYTAEQVTAIKAKIRSAYKKAFGHEPGEERA